MWREGRHYGRQRRQRRPGYALGKQPHDHGAPLSLPLLQQAHVGAHGADERSRRARKGWEDVRAGKVRARVRLRVQRRNLRTGDVLSAPLHVRCRAKSIDPLAPYADNTNQH